LSCCYLVVAFGITLNIHYCGGNIKEVSLFTISEEGCCGSEEESSGCCDDDVAVLKLKDDQRSSTFFTITPQSFLTNTINTEFTAYILSGGIIHILQNYHSPPVFYGNPIYLRNRVLTI